MQTRNVRFIAVLCAVTIILGTLSGVFNITADEACPFFNDEDAAGWTVQGKASLSRDVDHTEGATSLSVQTQADGTGNIYLIRSVSGGDALDLTGMKYFSFDLWVEGGGTDIFSSAYGDCGVNFTNGEKLDGGGVMVKAAALRGNTLKAGWNKIEATISFDSGYTTDIASVKSMRFYFNIAGIAGQTVKFDNFAVSETASFMGADVFDDETAVGWWTNANGAFYMIDADCVGMMDDLIPWELNSRFLDLLAKSGTPLFVSCAAGKATKEQKRDLAAAYKRASYSCDKAVPLDWEYNKTPNDWLINGVLTRYDWTGDHIPRLLDDRISTVPLV